MRTFITTLLLFSVCTLRAQQSFKLTGSITDGGGGGLPYATVGISSGGQQTAVLSNEAGSYSLPLKTGRYLVKVSLVGYTTYQDSVTISGDKILNIRLEKDAKTLAEVNVVAAKPIIEQKIDRLTFNVANSVFNRGFSAMEVLSQAPRVEVSPDGQLSLIGKSTLAVMIDGRIISGDAVKDRLAAIRSDNIASIEVITMPPAKYSAQGNSGLLNIALKKNPNLGWLFSFNTGYQQRTFAAGSQSVTVNYKSSKLDVNFNTNGFIEKRRFKTDLQFEQAAIKWDNDNVRDPFGKNVSVNTSLNYKLTKKMNVGFLGDITTQKVKEDGVTSSVFQTIGRTAADSAASAIINNAMRYTTKSATAYYDFMIDSLGKKLTVNGSYFVRNNGSDVFTNNQINSKNPRQELFTNTDDTRYQGSSVNLDLELPYKFAKIETGGALAYVNNHSLINATGKGIPIGVNDFLYKENTAALYVSGSKKLGKSWSAKAGLRYERTGINSELVNTGLGNSTAINNLFPSLFLSYTPKNNSITIAYSKRIQRPSFSLLNPFRSYVNSYTYRTGNPYLLPAFSDNVELTHIYKNNLTTTLSGTVLNGGFGSITTFKQGEALTESKPFNYIKTYSGNLYVAYTFSYKWLNSYNSFSLTYNRSVANKNVVVLPDVNGFTANYSIRNTLTLNSKKTTFAVVNYQYGFPGTSGFFTLQSRSNLEAGVRFQSHNGMFMYNLVVSDILRTGANRTAMQYNGARQTTHIYNDLRYLNFSVTYSFGNAKARANTKYIDGGNKNRTL
ncbi:outer membrane beta-barrel protein [Mucilaginibacter calamicampi]|uniref:Outer membrane beta-barrel protein n=1 Tax=Mucilaginibacter calamicampi TaxID=1302352 RepID=A0ABW2YSV2_9SPHI